MFDQQIIPLFDASDNEWREYLDKMADFFRSLDKMVQDMRLQFVNELELVKLSTTLNTRDEDHLQIAHKVTKKKFAELRCKDIDTFEGLFDRAIIP
jgi:hypothetical protein